MDTFFAHKNRPSSSCGKGTCVTQKEDVHQVISGNIRSFVFLQDISKALVKTIVKGCLQVPLSFPCPCWTCRPISDQFQINCRSIAGQLQVFFRGLFEHSQDKDRRPRLFSRPCFGAFPKRWTRFCVCPVPWTTLRLAHASFGPCFVWPTLRIHVLLSNRRARRAFARKSFSPKRA